MLKNPLKKSLSLKMQLVVMIFVILASVLSTTFIISFNSAKKQVLNVGGEMFGDVVKDTVGFMDAMNERVKAGDLTLKQAQEIVRTYVLGPKKEDGTRDISKTKMSTNSYMYIWASHPNGTFTMHPFNVEGKSLWDYQVNGKYTVRDSWSNPNKTGVVFEELWQNQGEPVYTFIAHQIYYKPWDWVVGAGGRKEIIYANRLAGMKNQFIIIALVSLVISLFISYFFADKISKKIERLNYVIGKASQGDLTETVNIPYKDELGTLSDNFNGMVSNLKSMIKKVKESAESVSAASQQISASTEEIASGSMSQANAAQTMNELFKELSFAINSVARSAEQASELSDKTMGTAQDGGKVIRSSIDGMNRVNQQMSRLEEDSNKIGEIIEVIDDIADQTNLLALNAAIEAARAGDQGRGFAVVADEVRKLAERSSEATKQITSIIKGMQENTQQSVKLVGEGVSSTQKTGEAFENIISMVNDSAHKVTEIAAASEEQAAQSSEVMASIESISAATEEAAASSEETASTAQSLAQLAEELSNAVSTFKIN